MNRIGCLRRQVTFGAGFLFEQKNINFLKNGAMVR